MFLDASALVAIVAEEPGFEKLLGKLGASKSPRFVSALVKFETVLAVARIQTKDGRKPDAVAMRQAEEAVDALLLDLEAKEMAVTPDIAREALHAARTYGKIVGHPAALNFGDCFAYACAKALNVPLLYNGNDFSRTDLA